MVRMPSLALMKSLYAAAAGGGGGGGGGGAFGVRAVFTREAGGGAELKAAAAAPRRGLDCWRKQRAASSGRQVDATITARSIKERERGALFRNWPSTAFHQAHRLNQSSGYSTMVSALKQSAAVASYEEQSDDDMDMDKFVDVAHKVADSAGHIIRQYFRTKFDILDKDDSSPVTIADRKAENAMTLLLKQHFPTHGIYGEEGGLTMPEESTDYVWVLDPIDGTKSFITGKPLFGVLIALVHKGVPILGIIDQPVLGERWVGRAGKVTTLNGEPISSRSSVTALKDAYLYTTSPHLFSGSKEAAFIRVRDKVKAPLYGCDCYAYGLLAAGHTDLVVESGLKPYDYLALVPVIEGAGGYITDWEGKSLRFWPNSEYPSSGEGGTEVAAAGSAMLHEAALATLARN